MLMLRIKQAQCALADGRLEEAWQIVQEDQIRQHRQGQNLLGQLARALTQRGQEHLQAGRLAAAQADCTKAEKLAGHLADVAVLRQALADTIGRQRQDQQQQQDTIKQAQDYIQRGWLTNGAALLQKAGEISESAVALKEWVDVKRQDITTAAEKIREALAREDIPLAAEMLKAAGDGALVAKEMSETLTLFERQVADRLEQSFRQGRLDQMQALWPSLAAVAGRFPGFQEWGRALDKLQQAGEQLAQRNYRQALVLLRQVESILPQADWLKNATEQTQRAADAAEAVQAGPLGWLVERDLTASLPADRDDAVDVPQVKTPPRRSRSQALPDRWVLQVDGVGSFLVLTGSRVTIGPVSSAQKADVGLVAPPDTAGVELERQEDDYFLKARGIARVNGQVATERLLRHNDVLELSPRCRLAFKRPNAASATALLQLEAGRYPQLDIRQVILLDRELIMGPQTTAHIRTEPDGPALVLVHQDGQIYCRTSERIEMAGQAAGAAMPALAWEVPVRIGSLTLVIKAAP